MKQKTLLLGMVVLAQSFLMNLAAQERHELKVPDIEGYKTLKCDSIFTQCFPTDWYGHLSVWEKLISKDSMHCHYRPH